MTWPRYPKPRWPRPRTSRRKTERPALGHLRDCVQCWRRHGHPSTPRTSSPPPTPNSTPRSFRRPTVIPRAAKPPANDSIAAGVKRGASTRGAPDGGGADAGRATARRAGVADLGDMEHIVGATPCRGCSPGFARVGRLRDGGQALRPLPRLDPLMPLYVGAAAVVKDRDELLAMARGSNLGSNLGSRWTSARSSRVCCTLRLQRLPSLTDASVPATPSSTLWTSRSTTTTTTGAPNARGEGHGGGQKREGPREFPTPRRTPRRRR